MNRPIECCLRIALGLRGVKQNGRKENTRKEFDLTKMWQRHRQLLNPVSTEALVQLTLGGATVGLQWWPACKPAPDFDPAHRHPGLPQDVAALVEKLEPDRTLLQLENLKILEGRRCDHSCGHVW